MKFSLKSRYPHEWEKIASKDDDSEFLVRKFDAVSLLGATGAASSVAAVATKLEMENQVHLSIYSNSFMIFINFSYDSPVGEEHYELAGAIESELTED